MFYIIPENTIFLGNIATINIILFYRLVFAIVLLLITCRRLIIVVIKIF